MGNIYEKYIDSLEEDPYNDKIFRNFYSYLKQNEVRDIDSLLELSGAETRLEYIDALTYCYLRSVKLTGHKHSMYSDSDYLARIFPDKILDAYEIGRYAEVKYDTYSVRMFSNKWFIIADEIKSEHFKPALVYYTKVDRDIYYSHKDVFHPVQVAMDSLENGGIPSYRKWLFEFAECNDLVIGEGLGIEMTVLSTSAATILDLFSSDIDYMSRNGYLYVNGNLYEIDRWLKVDSLRDVYNVERNIKSVYLVSKSGKQIGGLMNLDTGFVALYNENECFQMKRVVDGGIKRKFIMGNC